MKQTPEVFKKLHTYIEKYGIKKARYRLSIGAYAMRSLLEWEEGKILNIQTLKKLYTFFDMPFDDFYYSCYSVMPSIKRHEGIVGSVLRAKRIRLGYTIDRVASNTKISSVSIARLERGSQLPHYRSYTIMKLMEFYEMDKEEKDTIQWLLVLINDAVGLFKKELGEK